MAQRVSLTVLTSIDVGGDALLVVPFIQAVTALSTWATLLRAGTFADVRQDVGAWLQVDNWLPSYIEREEQEGRHARGADDEDFDASTFFGDDYWRAWTPDQRELTTDFLYEYEEEIAERFLQPDSAWGFDWDSHPYLLPSDREAIESALRARGHTVKAVTGLASLFCDPTDDPAATLVLAVTDAL